MKNKSFKYILKSGKNSKIKYYAQNFGRLYLMPNCLCRIRRERILRSLEQRSDKDYILDRVDYYCKLNQTTQLNESATAIKDFKRKGHRSVYFFDSYEYVRYFDRDKKWAFTFGDVIDLQATPSIVKSRPLVEGNQNSVLLNMDKVRHFVFLKDKIPFEQKINKAIFRGEIESKPRRIAFMERWFGEPLCDIGEVGKRFVKQEWRSEMLPLYEHFNYKFVVSLEGNDVASNLKWVMASNCLAIMPKPTCETWFMEGKLIGNFHYVEIKDDYSDLVEKINYYTEHIDEAKEIIKNANLWTKQFRNKKRERLISLLVMEKYFKMTGQI